MNKKNKKNRNKVFNPNPVPKKNENENLVTESDTKITENKAEIVPKEEVTADSKQDIFEKTSDSLEQEESTPKTPKKPKRNRNKKKKDEAEVIEPQSDKDIKQEGIIHEIDETASLSVEHKVQGADLPITPASIKKNKKNKKQDIQTAPTSSHETFDDNQNKVPVIQEPIIGNLTPAVNKDKTKNKKGKKRYDSENSEETLACTAAFQKLIVKEEQQPETKNTDTKILEQASESSVSEATVTEILPKKLNTERPKSPNKTEVVPKKLDTERPVLSKKLDTERPKSPNITKIIGSETDDSEEISHLLPESQKKGKHKKNIKEPNVNKETESTIAVVSDVIDKIKEDLEKPDTQSKKKDNVDIKTQETISDPLLVSEEAEIVKSLEQEKLDKGNEDEHFKKSNKKKKNKPILSNVTEQTIKSDLKEEIKENVAAATTDVPKHTEYELTLQEHIEIQSDVVPETRTEKKLPEKDTKETASQGKSNDKIKDVTIPTETRKEEHIDFTKGTKHKAKIAKPVTKDSKRSIEITLLTKPTQEELLPSLEIKQVNPENISSLCSFSEETAKVNAESKITEVLAKEYLKEKTSKQSKEEISETNIPKETIIENIVEEAQKTDTSINNPENMRETLQTTQKIEDHKDVEQDEKLTQPKTDSLKRQKKRNKHQPSDSQKQEFKDTKNDYEGKDTGIKIEPLQGNLTNTTEHVPDMPITTPDQIEYPRPASADGSDLKRMPKSVTVTDITETENKKEQDYKVEVTSTPVPKKTGLKKEKTDLKSKVIEVNKDMEDLKISIEKSLAELSALEDKEAEIEHNFETKLQESLQRTQKIEEHQDAIKKDIVDAQILITESLIQDSAIESQFCSLTQILDKQEQKPVTDTSDDLQLSAEPQPPTAPSRKDNKDKNKKKKIQQGVHHPSLAVASTCTVSTAQSSAEQTTTDKPKSEENKETKDEQKKAKQKSDVTDNETNRNESAVTSEFPIEHFEDALTSSADDVNETFDIIVKESSCDELENEDETRDKNIKEKEQKNENIPQPKNLLGHPNILVQSNKIDYKKEKNKTPNAEQAKAKIKDGSELSKETKGKVSKECQTRNKTKIMKPKNESSTHTTYDNEEFIYKYSFRNVFLPNACHICKKILTTTRVECNFCHLFFYCSQKHKDKDWSQHQALCFAVSTITHLKGQKHIYADSQNVTGQNYRLLRMQMIISCEKILKRKLTAWEQEAVLYPRVCADPGCRQWKTTELTDCGGCQQISYCSKHLEHLPPSHSRWCKSYSLYQRLVIHQLLYGRIEPTLPKKCMMDVRICDNINRVLADMYDEKIEMDDLQYASLCQIATAPLTAAYCYQMYDVKMENTFRDKWKKTHLFTIHVIDAELQFEADSLTKWETFFLHLRPDVQELRVTLIGTDLNPSSLPLDLLRRVRMCETCRNKNRRVVFKFQDKMYYHDYFDSLDFVKPDIVCAFNTAISRSYNTSDIWSNTLKCIFKQRVPLVLTSYSMTDLQNDIKFIEKKFANEFNIVTEAKYNPFASVRPDRNFKSDDVMPLLFRNYCFCVVIGAF